MHALKMPESDEIVPEDNELNNTIETKNNEPDMPKNEELNLKNDIQEDVVVIQSPRKEEQPINIESEPLITNRNNTILSVNEKIQVNYFKKLN